MDSPASVPLGDTGLQVSSLGLGLAALGRPAYINLGRDIGERRAIPDLQRRTHEVLDAAYEAGIRYVDAARSYGRAEEFLASWLEATGRDVTVGSKWGYRYVGDWRLDVEVHEIKDHSLQALEGTPRRSASSATPRLSDPPPPERRARVSGCSPAAKPSQRASSWDCR